MKRNLFFILCFVLVSMVILIPLKADTHDDQGRLEEEDTEACNIECSGGSPGSDHYRGTGTNNARCDECASIKWDVCEDFLDEESICVEVGDHVQSPCPAYDKKDFFQTYNENAREYIPE